MNRTPAEWEPHEGTWLAWPFRPEEWGEALRDAQDEWIAFARALLEAGEELRVLVPDEDTERALRQALGAAPRWIRARYGDCWLRDTAPVTAHSPGGRVGVCFRFNGWGGKYQIEGDEDLAVRVATAEGLEPVPVDLVLEGGAIEMDGAGTAITTRSCALDPHRNPGVGAAEVEAALRDALGATRVVWLERGLRNDHTDGHVDTLARFTPSGEVLAMRPGDQDPNHDVLSEVLDTLVAAAFTVRHLPSPGAVREQDGELLPASYANYYVANGGVIVPIYGVPTDDAAVASIAEHFPGRRVVGRMARAILHGGGAFHCITQQVPR